ncbi:MAG: GNAT family N-acetyltransferase [Bacteroidota bacterium]
MQNNIKIRRADESDFETINSYINELEKTVFDKNIQHEIYSENISNEKNIYLVATKFDQVIGYLSCHTQNLLHHSGRVGEIQEMFVSHENRGLGIGKALVDKLKTISINENILQLEVTSNIKRNKAHRFYQNQQFEETHKKFVFKLIEQTKRDEK